MPKRLRPWISPPGFLSLILVPDIGDGSPLAVRLLFPGDYVLLVYSRRVTFLILHSRAKGAVDASLPTARSARAPLELLATLLQDGCTVKLMERSGLWLVRVRWNRTGLLKSPDQQPTIDEAIAKDTPFLASGRRHESDNYLFFDREDAESFKVRFEENLKRKVSPKWKARADILEVTPEDVAHLDLDPMQHKTRNTKA